MDFPALHDLQLHSWPFVLFGCLAAVAVIWAAFHVVRRILASQWFSHSMLGQALRTADSMLQLVVVALALQFVLGLAPDDLPHMYAARHVVGVALILAVTFAITHLIDGAAGWVVSRHPANVSDNLAARRVLTQMRVMTRAAKTLIVIVGAAAALMSFEAARKFGVSLLASAGVAGLIIGLAAKSVLGNLLAGLQIAFTQPIRLDDVLIVEGEWGRVEEITATYIVFHIWDDRRLIVPLTYFIGKPFQNWTRTSAQIMGNVTLWLDYGVPLAALRAEIQRLVEGAEEWDRRFWNLQVVDASDRAMQVRVLLTSQDASLNWDLRCKVREGVIDFIRRRHPDALPRVRAELNGEPPPRQPERQPPERAAQH